MFSHAMEKSDNFKKTIAEFHKHTSNHIVHHDKNGVLQIQLASLHAR